MWQRKQIILKNKPEVISVKENRAGYGVNEVSVGVGNILDSIVKESLCDKWHLKAT